MSYQQQENNKQKNKVQERASAYEKAEMELLRSALNRSYTERFHVMTRLIRRGIMLKNAKITHYKGPSGNLK